MNTTAPETDASDSYLIEKQDYSAGAWRVLDATGQQVYRREVFDHPSLGSITITGPVCFDRKRDARAWVDTQTANLNRGDA